MTRKQARLMGKCLLLTSYNCDRFPLELQLFYRHRKSVGWRPGMVVHALQPGLAYLALQEANFKTILKN